MRAMTKCTIMIAAMLVAFAAPAGAADSDLHSSAAGDAAVEYGTSGSYTVTYGNNGPDTAISAYVNVAFPAGVPAPFDTITQGQVDFIEASMLNSDTLGNVPLLFAASSCDALLIQNQGPSSTRPDPLDFMTSGAQGTFNFATEFPLTDPSVGVFMVHAPASLSGNYTNLGRGSCDDCGDIANTCFGEPLALLSALNKQGMLANDGTGTTTDGCDPLVGDYTNKIAFIDRGSCEFGVKVANAEDAGAVGAVIINNDQCSNLPPSPDCVISMGPGAVGNFTSIPAVMVSQNDGTPIKTELQGGGTVTVSLGGVPTQSPMFQTNAFLATATDTDPDGTNNGGSHTTWLVSGTPVFVDGFESGDVSAWSGTGP